MAMTSEQERAIRDELRALREENLRLRRQVEQLSLAAAHGVGADVSDENARLRVIAENHAWCMSESRRAMLDRIHRLTVENEAFKREVKRAL